MPARQRKPPQSTPTPVLAARPCLPVNSPSLAADRTETAATMVQQKTLVCLALVCLATLPLFHARSMLGEARPQECRQRDGSSTPSQLLQLADCWGRWGACSQQLRGPHAPTT